MSVLKDRLLYGSLLLVGTVGLILVDLCLPPDRPVGFFALGLSLASAAWIEHYRLCGGQSRSSQWAGVVWVVGILAADWSAIAFSRPEAHPFALLLLLLWPPLLSSRSFRRLPTREDLEELARTTLAFVYAVLPFLFMYRLRFAEEGLLWVLLALLLIKSNDIGAFFTGRAIGRTPLVPVSPNKTVEGSIGGIALGVGVALVFVQFLAPLTTGHAIAIGLLVGVAGQVGDLVESVFKRGMGAKDSGSLIPAFGGVLDLLDSLLLGGPVLFFYTLILVG